MNFEAKFRRRLLLAGGGAVALLPWLEALGGGRVHRARAQDQTPIKRFIVFFWPGGVKNRLYDIENGETVTVPEIPCSFTATYAGGFEGYKACVNGALNQLYFHDVITADVSNRLRQSAFRAWDETH